MKRTIIVAGGAAAAALRLETARAGAHGCEIRSIEQAAARLASGFLGPVETDALTEAAAEIVRDASEADLGDLVSISDLPGLPNALASTLGRAWSAGIDLAERAHAQPGSARLATLAKLEAAILTRLPTAMLRPADLVQRALRRIAHAPRVLGPIECRFLPDLAPCWRPLLLALARHVDVAWNAGPCPMPEWVRSGGLQLIASKPATPMLSAVTCATARHEVVEAMRWARGLLAGGTVRAQQIAFAAATPGEFDDLVLTMSRDANLDVHFGHGRRALTTRDGQAAAALADIVLRGLSQDRVRRLARMAHDPATPFGRLPENWGQGLLGKAPLGSPARWRQAIAVAEMPAGASEILLPAIDLLAGGREAAAEIGEMFLRGASRLLWRRALARAPASALESTLGGLRVPDTVEAGASIAWMHASALASCPRPYVWLFGLNSRSWPRRASEDPLLPSHVVPSAELDPLPVTEADQAAFHAIRMTTAEQLVCCASRRDATGRLLGLSPLMPHATAPTALRRSRVPAHAMSEHDRIMARPDEFAQTSRSAFARACWRDWNDPEITAHDGLVRNEHPVLAEAVLRVHSAKSLTRLLRNPLGFTWRYALGWEEPEPSAEAMDLDAMTFGGLVHGILDEALAALEEAGGFGKAGRAHVASAVAQARRTVAARWEAEQPVPPAILWTVRLQEAEAMALCALSWPLDPYSKQRSYAELPFGDWREERVHAPWSVSQEVSVPDVGLRILGRIDRLDLADDGTRARVVDYKTGAPRDPGILSGGKELQRCLYAYAVSALLGPAVEVEAALLFPRRDGAYHPLEDTRAALQTLTNALLVARDSLRAGRAVPGVDAGDERDVFRFALPASPGAMTARKQANARTMLGDAALIWEAP